MNTFEEMLHRYFTPEELIKISATRVLIVGCGGLGSNIAKLLTRCGFTKLTIVDFDQVELSNLNRQDYFFEQAGQDKLAALSDNLRRINPFTEVKTVSAFIDSINIDTFLEDKDIVVEAVDNARTKRLIFEKCIEKKKPFVGASGLAGLGDCENIQIKRGKYYSIVGDMKTSINEFKPLAPKVAAVAAIQADEVLRRVLRDS